MILNLVVRGVPAALLLVIAAPAWAQLRVANWNVTNYSGGRVNEFQTAIYGVYQDRSMAPDVFIGQEYLSTAGVSAFLTLLNTAANSPGDWAAAPFVDGPDTDSAFFYRTTRVSYLGMTVVAVGGNDPNHPRNIQRYDVRPVGYTAASTTLACYSTHMKAGSASTDQARRLLEAQRIRDNAETLPAGWNFLLGGDFNIQTSSQLAYQEMVGSQANNVGRLFDPIVTPGSWNNNGAYRYVHTQDPSGAGGMDDRHDQILLSGNLRDGQGFDYLGNPAVAYSTTTWNDTRHSYRVWGNDGSSFDLPLTTKGNQMVGTAIAQALVSATSGTGHLPVFLDLRVPAEITSDLAIDFGQVEQGDIAEQPLTVTNTGDVQFWSTNGVAALNYTLQASAGFSAPAGTLTDPPGGSGDVQLIEMDTSTVGLKSGTVTILSNAPDQPVRVLSLVGEVLPPPPPGDLDDDGDVDLDDAGVFVSCMNGPEVTVPPLGCDPQDFDHADLDMDFDVDLEDAAFFCTLFGG